MCVCLYSKRGSSPDILILAQPYAWPLMWYDRFMLHFSLARMPLRKVLASMLAPCCYRFGVLSPPPPSRALLDSRLGSWRRLEAPC